MGQNATWIIENIFLILEKIQDLHYCIGAYGNFMGMGLVLCVTQQWMERILEKEIHPWDIAENKLLPLMKAHVG